MNKSRIRYRLNRLKSLENLLEWAKNTKDGAEITIKLKRCRYSCFWEDYKINNVESSIDGEIMLEVLELLIEKENRYLDRLLKEGGSNE